MLTTLLATKLYIPPARETGVQRLRLTERLQSAVDSPGALALLSGPAGFGKTTLLSQFVAQLHKPVAWLSLDEGDNDPVRFWSYLIAACQKVQEEIGETALALLGAPQPLPLEAIPASLINDIDRLEQDLVLVLDDFHVVQNQSIHTALSFLLDHSPDKLHLLVSTRADPPWPLARYRARNRLVEIRARDLRFTGDEAAWFLNRLMGLDLAPEAVAALEARTEGWAAGLQLAALSLQGRSDTAGFVKTFTGSHVYVAEYLAEEVLQRQPAEVQSFLLKTSILERLTAGVCEAIVGCQDGQSMLANMQKANLFILPLDDEGRWFRYHALWKDLLLARLRHAFTADEIAALHRLAAAWYERAGMVLEAIEHALAGADYAHMVALSEKVGLPMILQGYVGTLEGWLRAIPEEYVERNPRINLNFAWLYLLRGPFDQAAPYLARLLSIFTASGESRDPALEAEWLAVQSKLLNMQGKPAESRDLANRALQILPPTEALVRSMILVNLATAYQQLLDYDHAVEAFQMIIQLARAAGDHISETLGISGQAQMYLMQGRLHLAFETASEGLKRVEMSRKAIPFSATLYGEIGQIHYSWHQLDPARSYSLRSMQTSGQSGYSDPEIFHHLMLSRMAQTEGDWPAAAQEMQQAADLAHKLPPAMIREEVISQQVRVYLAEGRLAAAEEMLKQDGFSFEGDFTFPPVLAGGSVTHPVGLLYNSALRMILFRARENHDTTYLQRGIDLSGHVLAGEFQCHNIPIALETLLLRSQLYTALGDPSRSQADVIRALELAEPEGFISVFIEEGPPVAQALGNLLLNQSYGTVQPAYIQKILAAFPEAYLSAPGAGPQPAADAPGDMLVEPLTPRELEVLRLVAGGDSNAVIAEKLVITVSAVKKHTANIYGKLSVNSRTQAVARARRIGLLPQDR